MRTTSLVLVLSLLALGLLTTAASSAPDRGDGHGDGQAGRYIVVLDEGDPNDVARDHSRRHDAEVSHVYTSALQGYAATMSAEAAERIANDRRVAYLDEDRPVEALHHRCDHSGGPGGESHACGSLAGTVTDGNEDALEDVTVEVAGTSHSGTTDQSGEYRIDDIETDTYEVTANKDGYTSATASVEIEKDDVTTQNFTLAVEDDGGGDGGDDEDGVVPWGVQRTGARDAHGGGDTGSGVSIYVIDSGIRADHPDLEGNLATNFDTDHEAVVACHKIGGESCATDWDDDHGHGTHVSGTAAASGDKRIVGVAPEATLHAVKVLDRRGRGWRSDVLAGIDWVTDREDGNDRPAVANVSLGSSGEKTGQCRSDPDEVFTGSDSYHQAICEATHAGVVFAVAAGNSDADASGTVPAAYDDTVMTISATHCDLIGDAEKQNCEENSDHWAEFSNYGDVITVAAPGKEILSTWVGSDYHVGSGTSMASPHAAGAAALLIGDGVVASTGYTAFADTQATIVENAESTDPNDTDWPQNDDHDEGFLDVLGALDSSGS